MLVVCILVTSPFAFTREVKRTACVLEFSLLYRHQMDGIQQFCRELNQLYENVQILSNQSFELPPSRTIALNSHHYTTAALHATLSHHRLQHSPPRHFSVTSTLSHHRLPLSPLHHCSATLEDNKMSIIAASNTKYFRKCFIVGTAHQEVTTM